MWTKVGDRLDILANRFYKHPKLWWVIAQANNIGEGGFAIKTATRLRIPMNVSEIINDLEEKLDAMTEARDYHLNKVHLLMDQRILNALIYD